MTEARTMRAGGHEEGFGATTRDDAWWVGPALTVAGIVAFIIYATIAALLGNHYYYDPYLSPFYSPVMFANAGAAGGVPVEHAWFGGFPGWWPAFIPQSPAFLILAFPGVFRLTCYYYRKAYYRSFAGAPPACAVGARPQTPYKGETHWLLFQNLHRYALYFALLFIVFLGYDALKAFFKDGRFGIGVGTVVLVINVVLLTCFTCGCHAFRHLVGGRLDCFSCSKVSGARHSLWNKVTALNAKHQIFAWLSLFWVGFADLYIRLVSMRVITDFNTWN